MRNYLLLNLGRRRQLVLVGLALLLGAPALAQTAPAVPDAVRRITDVVGLQPRFELRATHEVPNAAAVVYGGKRYLLYNPDFLLAVNRAGRTDWAGLSILAHEMGHHLNGHTLRPGGSQPQDELEADEFSGFVLRKLGASLAEAQAALAAWAPVRAEAGTHPSRAPRLAAVGQGWQRADGQLALSARTAPPSAAPMAPASPATYPVVAAASAATAEEADAEDTALAAAETRGVPVRVVGQLTFANNPSQRFFLTSALRVLRIDGDANAEEVGHLERTRSQAFPFILTDSRQHRLMVSRLGRVFDRQGQEVAVLHNSTE